jgi:hypothetical protein
VSGSLGVGVGKVTERAAGWTLWSMDDPTRATGALAAPRAALYRALLVRRDALFEVIEAAACGGAAASLPHLSPVPGHRRGHGSVYAALRRGVFDAAGVRTALAAHPLAGGLPAYAVDVSVVARCDAETSPGRAYYHHPSRHSAGQPIVAGWGYSWLAQLGPDRSSWTAPMDARRLRPGERAEAVALRQISALLPHLPADPVPVFVFDAGYDARALTHALADARAAVLVRMRSDRVFYRRPPPYAGRGRPRRHGPVFRCTDPATWDQPTITYATDDPACGRVEVRCWAELHPRPARAPGKGAGRGRGPAQPLWLWYAGPVPPDPALLWRAYVHRFDLEHTLRFCKQRLGWDKARVRTPEQMDTWTWGVLAAYAQLRLARGLVADRRLPWERPLPADRLTPLRVQRGFGDVVRALGTPASAPQPCGRSPGRPKGRRSPPAPRCPAVKTTAARPRTARRSA